MLVSLAQKLCVVLARSFRHAPCAWGFACLLCACGDSQGVSAVYGSDAGATRAAAGSAAAAGVSAPVVGAAAGMRAPVVGAAAGSGGVPARPPSAGSSPVPDDSMDDADASVDSGRPVQPADAAVPSGNDAGDSTAMPPCLKKGSQVVLLGDSYINWVSHNFPSDLNALSGQTFRMYAVGGYAMGSGGIGFIPPQLDQAIQQDPDITTVVMTGGGNDVLVPDTMQFPMGAQCKESASSATIPDCQAIVKKALAAADTMLDNAVAHGVKDVIYFFYPRVPEGTLVGGAHPNAIVQYALPMVRDVCQSSFERTQGKLTCHFVDMIPVFEGHPDWFAPTDIHPNPMGSAAMAKAVWGTMKEACIAQPAASGCCTP